MNGLPGPEIKRPPRRLVLCCDGSWQSSNHGEKNIASNIAKLSRAIGNYGLGPNGEIIQQIVYYDAGVGTGTSATSTTGKVMAGIQKRWEGGFGRGLEENVCEGYNFIVNNWLPGDEIYIFGFSRGAYTARALAGMICNMGICFPDMMDDWWAMYEVYKTRKEIKKEEKPMPPTNEWKGTFHAITTSGAYAQPKVEFKDHFWQNVPIEVVGVFDTVGALGMPNNNWVDFSDFNEAEYGFHDTNVHPQIKYAFHALALDEHRKAFEPTLWHLPKENDKTKLFQCWFPGYHINVGGGSDHTAQHYGDLESMASLSLAWMIDQVRRWTSLEFEDYALKRLYYNYVCTIFDLSRRSFKLGDSRRHYNFGPTDKEDAIGVADPENPTAYGGWGMGYRPDSLEGLMKMAGSEVRTPGQYKPKKKDDGLVASQPGETNTHEYIHPVVAYALGQAYQDANGKTALRYEPSALDGFERVKDPVDPYKPNDVRIGIFWRKEVDADEPEPSSYAKKGWDYAKSFIWTPEPTKKNFIYIREMPLWWDRRDNYMNERDYIRADWLAFKAPKLGFDHSVEKDVAAYLETIQDSEVTPREEQLLEFLQEAADKTYSSIWKEKSLTYTLRGRPSPGLEQQKSERMQQTGERTRQFLADLDEDKI
ncbi:hypothetical protein ASPCADRAFT_209504 [Aspergillus carbonarius ITEM 5010]|uniref:T6SS Phospholipase effector Tle1-like catalytic domain-containing protein n=1 Tax=Aspergillus carbonarius (strain ITEM 5010) TaxID=602072 RepID=A0A1R3RGG7_ASPC5|nr:hypothetical protein ASPCADRAFT_209504 [Aspergillus carbonarius ITEM 5010]